MMKDYIKNDLMNLINGSYDGWIRSNSNSDITDEQKEILSDLILLTATISELCEDREERKQLWLEKFKNEPMVLNKLKELK